jgi:hypothetical protein
MSEYVSMWMIVSEKMIDKLISMRIYTGKTLLVVDSSRKYVFCSLSKIEFFVA